MASTAKSDLLAAIATLNPTTVRPSHPPSSTQITQAIQAAERARATTPDLPDIIACASSLLTTLKPASLTRHRTKLRKALIDRNTKAAAAAVEALIGAGCDEEEGALAQETLVILMNLQLHNADVAELAIHVQKLTTEARRLRAQRERYVTSQTARLEEQLEANRTLQGQMMRMEYDLAVKTRDVESLRIYRDRETVAHRTRLHEERQEMVDLGTQLSRLEEERGEANRQLRDVRAQLEASRRESAVLARERETHLKELDAAQKMIISLRGRAESVTATSPPPSERPKSVRIDPGESFLNMHFKSEPPVVERKPSNLSKALADGNPFSDLEGLGRAALQQDEPAVGSPLTVQSPIRSYSMAQSSAAAPESPPRMAVPRPTAAVVTRLRSQTHMPSRTSQLDMISSIADPELRSFLSEIGLPDRYSTMLSHQNITFRTLSTMRSDSELARLGVDSARHRQSILDALTRRTSGVVAADPAKTGWLKKRGDRVKTWKDRYFVLAPKDESLLYFGSEGAPRPKGVVNMRFASDARSSMDRGHGKHEFCMELVTPNRVYLFAAETEKERFAWIEALKEACGGLTPAGGAAPLDDDD